MACEFNSWEYAANRTGKTKKLPRKSTLRKIVKHNRRMRIRNGIVHLDIMNPITNKEDFHHE